MDKISFKDYSFGYNGVMLMNKLNFSIKEGEKFCILGPSGEGKTTILNCITGISRYQKKFFSTGELIINQNEKIKNGHIGYVFQDLALFPHMTVFENVAFPLKVQRFSKGEIHERVKKILSLVRLSDKSDFSISELSGGQKQRVALGRAIILNPTILCLDEPLKGLEPQLKQHFIDALIKLHDEFKFTLIYVTHDREEAYYTGDRLCIILNGQIQQIDTAQNIYVKPANLDVAKFTGDINVLTLEDFYSAMVDRSNIPFTANIAFRTVAFRPENLRFEAANQSNGLCKGQNILLKGRIMKSQFLGNRFKSTVSSHNCFFTVEGKSLTEGDEAYFSIAKKDVIFY